MTLKSKSKLLALIVALAMVFTMMPVMGAPVYAVPSTIELDGGSYTLTRDNLLVKDGTSGDEINIHSNQKITFKGNTEIKLNGYKLMCKSIKSGFENPSDPDIAKHPWYSYDLTIDGGDEGGSIQIGDSTMEDYAVAAYNLTIQNLSAHSEVSCLRESGNKVAIYAKNDLRIEGIKKDLVICGAIGMEARDGETNISDVSGLIVVNAKRNGIDTDDTNKNDIKISSSNVVIGVDDWDGNCIKSGWKKGGISITDSIVEMSNSNNNEPTSTSKGGYNALSASGTVNIKDSYVTAENRQKDRPAMLVYEDTGKLIISGESMLGCQNVEGGSASALMANAIELKDGNRLFMPKDGYIGKTKYNGGSDEKEMYTVLDKDGNTTEKIGFGSGKELIHTVSAPSKVFPGTPIHMSGVLKDEDGEPVPNALLYIEYEKTFSREVITNDQGIWEYKEDAFTPSDPGEVSFEIHFYGTYVDGESPVKGYVRYLPQSESPGVKVQVINEGFVETLEELKLAEPPEGESRKTEYKCGEEFDLDASYVQAIIKREEATGGTTSEARPLDPSATTITPSVLKHGTDKVSISYMFEGTMASLDYPITVSHDWKEATCTEPKTCKGCGTTEGKPLGHTEVIDEAKAPTCTETGMTEGKHCSACGKVLVEQDPVSALGHDWSAEFRWTGDEANGYTKAEVNYACSRCETAESVEAELKESVTEPACETGGKTTYTATVSAEKSLDKEAHSDSKDAKITEALGHSFDQEKAEEQYLKKAADCTHPAEYYMSCSRCDASSKGAGEKEASFVHGDPLGHNWDDGVVTKKATTTATGIKTFTCETCKETRTETIPKLAKKANPLKVKGKTANVKHKKLKKKTQTLKVSKVIKFTKKGQGKMSYKKSSVTYTKAKSVKMSKKALKKYKKKVAKKIKINTKTGKVTVKKGLKKGTYKVKAKVKAAGNANYKASKWKIVTFKIKVK